MVVEELRARPDVPVDDTWDLSAIYPTREAWEAAIDQTRASLGVLGSALDSVLGPLGLTTALADLGDLDVEAALDTLTSSLGVDMGHEEAGLLLQGGKVKAARFMTIAPSALPAVDSDYRGPVTDYLGVGPKIVRLVR